MRLIACNVLRFTVIAAGEVEGWTMRALPILLAICATAVWSYLAVTHSLTINAFGWPPVTLSQILMATPYLGLVSALLALYLSSTARRVAGLTLAIPSLIIAMALLWSETAMNFHGYK
jgi:hypothetical protein